MKNNQEISSANDLQRQFEPSDELIGFDRASLLLLIGGGCLLIVLIFGIILCRLDISAGNKRRARAINQIED